MALRRFQLLRYVTLLAAVFAIYISTTSGAQTQAHGHAIVDWYAELRPVEKAPSSENIPAMKPPAAGTTIARFDFERQTVTFVVHAKDVTGVRKIELRVARSTGDLDGPTIFTLYDLSDGTFTGEFTKTVSQRSFQQVSTPIMNGQAAIVITTDTHPEGAFAGFITMHKQYAH